MQVTAAQVKELRNATGAGIMDAKRALIETNLDMEAAVDWLRTKGLAQVAKKSGRTAAEGLVGVHVEGGAGVAVEVNSETDFVARNQEFQGMVRDIAKIALSHDTVEDVQGASLDGRAVKDVMVDRIASIGENMAIRRLAHVKGDSVAFYVHNSVSDGLGKIGVLVGIKGADDKGFGKQLAMHIASENPSSLSESDLDPELVARERKIYTEQARESGKPEQVIEKMITGRMGKFFEEVILLRQKFIMDTDITVEKAAAAAGVEITGFARLEVGEGIEKAVENFADEVAKQISG